MHQLPPWSEVKSKNMEKNPLPTGACISTIPTQTLWWLKSKNIHSKILPAIAFPFFFFLPLKICAQEQQFSMSLLLALWARRLFTAEGCLCLGGGRVHPWSLASMHQMPADPTQPMVTTKNACWHFWTSRQNARSPLGWWFSRLP